MYRCTFHHGVKVFLCVSSFLHCLFGVFLFAIGSIFLTLSSLVDQIKTDNKEDISKIKRTIPPFFPEPYNNFSFPSDEINDISDFYSPICMVNGFVMFSFGVVGCCTIQQKHNISFIVAYAFCNCVLVIIWSVILGYGYDYTYNYFDEALDTYKGIGDDSFKGALWTGIMVKFECCGIKNYVDFMFSKSWPLSEFDNFTVPAMKLVAYLRVGKPKIQAVQISGNTTNSTDRGSPNSADLRDARPNNQTIDILNRSLQKFSCSVFNVKGKTEPYAHCAWLDSSNFMTPVACCRDVINFRYGCHVKHKVNTKNNNMAVGCGTKIINTVNDTENFLLVFMLIYVILCCFTTILILMKTERARSRTNRTIKAAAGKADMEKEEKVDFVKEDDKIMEELQPMVDKNPKTTTKTKKLGKSKKTVKSKTPPSRKSNTSSNTSSTSNASMSSSATSSTSSSYYADTERSSSSSDSSSF